LNHSTLLTRFSVKCMGHFIIRENGFKYKYQGS